MSDFKPGDVVRLKSGGPSMTVDNVGDHLGETRVLCTWFEKTKKHTEMFVPTSIEHVTSRPPPAVNLGYSSVKRRR